MPDSKLLTGISTFVGHEFTKLPLKTVMTSAPLMVVTVMESLIISSSVLNTNVDMSEVGLAGAFSTP